MSVPMLAGQASLWLQRQGPNTEPVYLGCHSVDGPSEEHGDLNQSFCPDEAVAGRFKLNGTWITEPGLPEVTLSTSLQGVLDEIERGDCRGDLFVHKVQCGRRDLFNNWVRSFALYRYHRSSDTYSDLAAKTPEDETESMLEAAYQAERLLKFVQVTPYRQGNAGVGSLLAIATCSVPTCADECGPAVEEGQYLVAVGTELAGSTAGLADVLLSADGGETWTAAAADPFAAGEDISAVICVPIDSDTNRIIVARGTTDPANPAEIAYSDDNGATWTNVDVGAVNGQYVLESEGLFKTDPYHLWLVTDGGYVYFSADQGMTWTAQESGALTTEDLRAIEFEPSSRVGYAVGDNNAILKTADGGAGWAVVTGPAGKATDGIYALAVLSANRVWIGYNDGELFYSLDGGATWTERVWGSLSNTGTINDLVFTSPLEGWLLHNTTGPVGSLWRTIDGGYNWARVAPMPTNAGLNAMVGLGTNHVHVVGAIQGATPVILTVVEGA